MPRTLADAREAGYMPRLPSDSGDSGDSPPMSDPAASVPDEASATEPSQLFWRRLRKIATAPPQPSRVPACAPGQKRHREPPKAARRKLKEEKESPKDKAKRSRTKRSREKQEDTHKL